MMIKHHIFGGLLAVGIPVVALAADFTDEMRFTRDGVMYRVDQQDIAQTQNAYRILEREEDPDVARRLDGKEAHLTIPSPITMKEALAILMKDSGMAVRFSGTRAMASASKPVGPMVISGSLLGAVRNLAKHAGVQAVLHRDAVDLVDSKTFSLMLPTYENATDMAARVTAARATNVKIVGGSIQFDATLDALQNVQRTVREVRAGRRGIASFMGREAARQDAALAQQKPLTAPQGTSTVATAETGSELENAEKTLLAQMGMLNKAGQSPQVAGARLAVPEVAKSLSKPNPVSVNADPLTTALVTMEFRGDAVDGLEQLAKHAGIAHRIIGTSRSAPVRLKFANVPLGIALEAFAAQVKGKADVEYSKADRRVSLRYR